MAEVPETGAFVYVEAVTPTVYDDGPDAVLGVLFGPDGEVLFVLERPFGYARWAYERKWSN